MKEIDIVIVNFFSEQLVLNCINSILESDYKNVNIIIVDNGSKTTLLKDLEHENVKVIVNEYNNGFGHACNIGVENSSSDLILFLNPDTKVFSNTILDSVNFMEQRNDITVMGCLQEDEDGNVHRTCARFITLGNYFTKVFSLNKIIPTFFKGYRMSEWDHKTSRMVDHVMGSFYLIRRVDFTNLGGFDKDYFVYYEDLDLSKRVRDNGGQIYYNSDIKIYHETGGTSKSVKAQRLFYSLDAMLTYTQKHLSTLKHILIWMSVFFIEPTLRLLRSFFNLNYQEIKHTFAAYKKLYKKRIFHK